MSASGDCILTYSLQTVCGISVVPGDWETLKRYNLTELYKQASSIDEVAANKGEEGDVGTTDKTECLAAVQKI